MINEEEKKANLKKWQERRNKYDRFELIWDFDYLYEPCDLFYQKICAVLQKTFLNKAKKEKKKTAKEHPRNELREQNDKERAHQKYVSNLAFKQNPHITEESNPIHQESSQQTNNMAAGRIMKQNEPAMAII